MSAVTPTAPEISPLARPDHERARRALVPLGVATALVAVFFETFRADSIGESVAMDVFGVVVTALVFGLVVSRGLRHEAAPVRALVLSVLGLLLAFPAFWSGLPLVLGAAGAVLGYAGKRASSRSGLCIAALVVGSLAVIAYLAIFVGDWIAHPGASWISGS
jgi:hypothetical protein